MKSAHKRDITNGKNTQVSRAQKFYTCHNADLSLFKCNVCSKIINGKCPANMVTHFKTTHKSIYFKDIAPAAEENVHIQRLKTLHSCVELVTINSNAFSLLSSSGFRNALEEKLRKFQLAGCGLNLSDHHLYEIKEKVRETANQIREQIKSETKGNIVSVMVDSATRNGRSVFGINIQYKHNGILRVVTIGMRELKQSHTADYLAEVLLKVLGEYEIKLDQVISITTDNGSNMLAMIKNLEKKLFGYSDCSSDLENDTNAEPAEPHQNHEHYHDLEHDIEDNIESFLQDNITDDDALDMILNEGDDYEGLLEKLVLDIRKRSGNQVLFVNSIKCAAHTIQLAVWDALGLLQKKDQNVIDLCRRAAKFLRLESTKNEMRRVGLTSILPALDVKTRWSSSYLMVRMIETRESA